MGEGEWVNLVGRITHSAQTAVVVGLWLDPEIGGWEEWKGERGLVCTMHLACRINAVGAPPVSDSQVP